MKVKIVKDECGFYIVKYKWLFFWIVDRFTYYNVIKKFESIKKAKKYIKKNYKKVDIIIDKKSKSCNFF